MKSSFYITNAVRQFILKDGFTKTVTFGNLFDIDLSKQSIFPLAHLIIGNASLNGSTVIISYDVLFMDIVQEDDSNVEDILNTQLVLANRLTSELIRGVLFDDLIQVENATAEPFIDRFENKLAGWALSFDAVIPNNMNIY
jgi:hypothetical protein